MHFKIASLPILDFPVPPTVVLKRGLSCFSVEQHCFQVYGFAHGSEESQIKAAYHAEIERQIDTLIKPETVVFYEGGLNRYAPKVDPRQACQIWWGDHDMRFTEKVKDERTLPLIYIYNYKEAKDVQGNVQHTKDAIRALEKVSQKRNLPRLKGNTFFHTVDTLLMACRIASELFKRGEGTSSLIICGVLHTKQLEVYLKNLNRLYQHFCRAMKALGHAFVPLKGVRSVSLREMHQFVKENPVIFDLAQGSSSL